MKNVIIKNRFARFSDEKNLHKTAAIYHTDKDRPDKGGTTAHRYRDKISASFVLIILILFIANKSALYGQERFSCGTVVSPETERLILEKVRSTEASRSGTCDDYPLNTAPKKYKLLLEYIKKSDGKTYPSRGRLDTLKAFIDSKYNPHGITFEYYEYQQDCDNCFTANDPGWKRTNPFTNKTEFKDCLWARLTGDNLAYTSLETGRLVASYNKLVDLPHELGHALGLFHTFNHYSNINTSSNENIIQDAYCPCNCRVTGDYVCDTPVDPFVAANQAWNDSMFVISGGMNTHQIRNRDSIRDNCGNDYLLLNSIASTPLFNYNIMSYHIQGNAQSGFSAGQASFMKNYSSGKPWEVNGASAGGGIMEGGFTVNSPMTITTSKKITGNVVINSTLFVTNATLSFLEDGQVIINEGGKLILDNAHLVAFDGLECIPATTRWKGLKINGTGYASVSLKNKSSISDAKVGIESISGAILAIKVTSGSTINSYWDAALKIDGKQGYIDIYDSNVNGTVNVKNINGVHFSNANFHSFTTDDNYFENTHLNITNNSHIDAPINVQNGLNKNVNIRNSNFSYSIVVSQCLGTAVIRDNIINSYLTLRNCTKFDVYNNSIRTYESVLVDGFFAATSPLIFKNKIYANSIGYKHNNGAASSILQCNSFFIKGDFDLELKEPIASNQGNAKLSSGNSFSRTATEISYGGNQKINYFYKNLGTEEPINISGPADTLFKKLETISTSSSACSLLYPNIPPLPSHCNNGVRDGSELGIDCGGACPPCPYTIIPGTDADHCTNGIRDADETGIDCGGSCLPCHCSNGVQDAGETGIDCSGTCPPCLGTSQCDNGILDGDETGIDCGGSCPPCSDGVVHCYNGVLDGDETGIDCGGSCTLCTTTYAPHCYNGVQDAGETGIDCGGSCTPCNQEGYPPVYEPSGAIIYAMADHSPYVAQLNGIYSSNLIPQGRDISVLADYTSHRATLDGGNSCALQNFIVNNSASDPTALLQHLQSISPMISANAIHILFAHSQYFTSAQIASIVALNPAVLTDRYISYLLYKTTTFTPAQRAAILAAAAVGSPRQTREESLGLKLQYKNAILRDNIAILSMNQSTDYHKLRLLLAQNPEITMVYEVAQTYADQHRYDLALQTLIDADRCQITDPIYIAQLDGMMDIYRYLAGHTPYRRDTEQRDATVLLPLVQTEHGMATDIARSLNTSQDRSSEVTFKRWQYEPLKFKTIYYETVDNKERVMIFPNPSSNVVNVNIPKFKEESNYIVQITNMEGKLLTQQELTFELNQINISTIPSGEYNINIISKGIPFYTSKIIITK